MTESFPENYSSVTGPQRNGTADLLKGIAVLLMIQVHITEQFCNLEFSGSFIGKISYFLGGPLCAPLFLIIMGYFIRPEPVKVRQYLVRGLLLFFGGILLNATRSLNLVIHILDGSLQTDIWQFIFGADILPLAGFSLLIVSPLIFLLQRKYILWFGMALLISALSIYTVDFHSDSRVGEFVISFVTGHTDWSYFPAIPWMSYIFTGIGIRCLTNRQIFRNEYYTDIRVLWWVLPVIIVLLITFPWAFHITNQLQGADGYYHHNFSFFGWTLIFLSLVFLIIRHWEKDSENTVFKNLIRWTGKNVTLIYVVQWLIIGNLATEMYRTQGLTGYLIWFPAILVVSLIISFLLIRIKQFITVIR